MPVEFNPNLPYQSIVDKEFAAFTAPKTSIPVSKPEAPVFNLNEPYEVVPEAMKPTSPAGGGAQFDPSQDFEKIFSIEEVKAKPETELDQDKGFRPVEFGLQNQAALQNDPESLEKLVRIYQARETRGTTLAEKGEALVKGTPKVAGALGKGVVTTAKRIIELSPPALLARAAGAATVKGGAEPEAKRVAGEIAEIPASVEAAAAGAGELLRRGGREVREGVTGLVGGGKAAMTPQEWRNRFFMDIAGLEQSQKAGQGNGAVLQALGNDADTLRGAGIELNPETIQELSVVTDPINWIPVGGAVGAVTKIGGRLSTRIVATTLNPEQAAKFANVLNTAREVASVGAGTIGKATQVAGRGVEQAGLATERAIEGLTGRTAQGVGLGALIGTGDITRALGVGVAAKVAPKAIAATGRAIQAGGEILTGARPVPAALQVAGQGVRGVGEGLLLSLPFAIGARPEEEETILGVAGLAGVARAGITAAPRVARAVGAPIQNVLAETIFRQVEQAETPQSAAYGIEPAFDSAHAATFEKLDPRSQKLVNWTRELFRDSGIEVYAVDNKAYRNQTGNTNTLGYAVDIGQKLAPDGTVSPVLRIFLNAEAEALPHELFHSLSDLDPKGAKILTDSVMKSWTPEQRKTFSDIYNTARNEGRPESAWTARLTDEAVAEEAGAEVFSRLYLGQDLSGVNPNVRQKAALFLSGILEKLGASLGKVGAKRGEPGVSYLGVRPGAESTRIGQEWIQNFLQRVRERGNILPEIPLTSPLTGGEVIPREISRRPVIPAAIPPPSPVVPTAPAALAPPLVRPPLPKITPSISVQPPARNIRVTRQQQDDFAARRAEDLGIERAKAASQDPNVQQRVNELSNLMESGNPVLEIDHRGVIAEGTAEAPSGRTTRRAEQEAAYIQEGLGAAPESVRDRHQKTFVPVRWEVVGGKPQLLAMSLDKVIANISRAVKDIVAAKQGAKIPYEVDASTGRLTDAGWESVVQDLQSYTENQSNGYRGDGQKLIRPSEDVQQSLPVENPGYNPTTLSEDKTNFLNLIQGLAVPLTAREVTGRVPGAVKGAVIARAQGREPQVPSVIRPKDLAKQLFKSGERILETNPLRNELAAAGVPVRELIEVTERINAGDILNVTPRPDLQFKAPVTDIIRGGFLPKNETAKRTPSQEIRQLAANYARKEKLDYKPSQDYVEVNPKLAKRLADFYDGAEHNPNDPTTKASYQALINETLKQYLDIENAGYTIEPFQGEGEPYKTSADAIKDIRENRHLYFLKTSKAFAGPGDNPLLQQSEVPGLTNNDIFRAVHDFFGHAKEGYSFGPRGEFNAWRAHSEMYSPEAQGALAAETLAQNSWVNFGKHLRDESGNVPEKGQPGYKDLTQRPFAEQKTVIVPDELITEAKQSAPEKFLPKEGESIQELGDRIRNQDIQQFKDEVKSWGKSLTLKAFEIGQNVKSLADIETLRKLGAEQQAIFKETLARGDIDTASALALKSQFYREAVEAATGEGGSVSFIRKYTDPNYRPPFPSEGVQFLPKQKGRIELSEIRGEFPGYLKTPEQDRISSLSADFIKRRGVTPQFWLNSETGKVLLAPDGHANAAEKVLPKIPSEPDALAQIYDEMHSRGWIRGVAEGTEAQPVELNGPDILGRLARQTAEDIAFASGREVRFNGEPLIEKPTPPEGQFLPKSKVTKRDEQGRPLTKEGLVDYNRLAVEQQEQQRKEAGETDYTKYEVPADPAPVDETPVNTGKPEQPLTVYHFGANPGIRVTQPSRMKTGVHKFWGEIPKTFFFVEGSEKSPGEQFAGRSAYRAVVDKSKLYDASQPGDPLDFFRPNRSEADAAMREAGYQGVLVPIKGGKQVVVMYDPIAVEPAGETTAKGTFKAMKEGEFLPKEKIEKVKYPIIQKEGYSVRGAPDWKKFKVNGIYQDGDVLNYIYSQHRDFVDSDRVTGDYQLISIDPKSIDTSEWSLRSDFVKELSQSKESFPPIVLDKFGSIIDGGHRATAAKIREDKKILAFQPQKELEFFPKKSESKE